MSRGIISALVLACVWSPTSAAPKVPEKGKAPLYFPTVVGERWVLAVTSGPGNRVTNADEVVAVSEKDGVSTVTVARLKPDGSRLDEYTVEASAEGVCVVAHGDKKYERPNWLVKEPTKPGSRWEAATPGGKVFIYKVGREEKVETPAGTFQAVRVETVDSTGAVLATEWFAPGRGRVQQVSDGSTVQLTSVTRERKE
jgi:hypothetical protein